MKTVRCLVIGLLAVGLSALAQEKALEGELGMPLEERVVPEDLAVRDPNSRAAPLPLQAVARDWISTQWRASGVWSNEVTGTSVEITRGYTELADGLNYLDEDGRWRASEDVIELTEAGAAAVRGPVKVFFDGNLNSEEAVRLVGRSGRAVRIRPVGLFYYDAASGEAVALGRVRDCQGELVPPNRVVYRSVLEGLEADLMWVWTRSWFETDLVLKERPRPPEAYGLRNRTTRLEMWHEVLEAPPVTRTQEVLEGEADPALRAAMVEPDLVDETLDFGDFTLRKGYGFAVGVGMEGAESGGGDGRRPWLPGEGERGRVGVGKRLVRMGDAVGLVESVPWELVRTQLEALPEPELGASLPAPAERMDGRQLPPFQRTASRGRRPFQVASLGYEPRGFCLDYYGEVSGGDSYSFAAGQTYYVSGPVSFTAGVTFGANAVIKYAPNASLTLYTTGSVQFQGTSNSPTIFTVRDEDIFGETIAGSTGRPTVNGGYPALSLYYNNANVTVSNARFRWARRGMTAVHSSPYSRTHTVAQTAFEYCEEGIYGASCSLVLQNSRQCGVATPLNYNPLNTFVSGALAVSCLATLGEAVDQPGWPFSTGGAGDWSHQTAVSVAGGDAARSGGIGHSQSTWLQTVVKGPGTVGFAWKVSSETGYDYLRCYVDGVPQGGGLSGESGWVNGSCAVTAGSHAVRWEYSKDGSVVAGQDAAWVDAVQFTPAEAPAITMAPVGGSVEAGATVTFTVQASGTAPLSYQWRFNGSPISGATGSVCTRSGVQPADSGGYSVVVSSPFGSATSPEAMLTVGPPPPCTPAPSGRVAWWAGEGNLLDREGVHPATELGGVTIGSGKVGQSFQFNGSSQNLQVADAAGLNPGSQLSFETWVYVTGNAWNHRDILSKDGEWWNRQYLLTVSDVNRFRPHVWLSSGAVLFDGNTSVALHTWYHVAMTYDGQVLRLYVNGVLDGSVTGPGGPIVTTTEPVRVGGGAPGGAPGYYFAGLIDEPTLYQRALSGSEVQAIYAAGSAGKCVGGVAPMIVCQPMGATASLGSDVGFGVVASGTGPLSYQWRRDGQAVPGATGSGLSLVGVGLADAGVYSVTVTNSFGMATSVGAELRVLEEGCNRAPGGLASWWRGEQNALDSAGSVHGVLNGVQFSGGVVGAGFSFNGINQSVTNLTPALRTITDSYTIEFWARPTAARSVTVESTSGAAGISGQRYAIFPDNNATAAAGSGVSVGTNGVSVFEHAPYYLPSLLVYNAPILDWTHLAVVYENRQPRLYVNGQWVRTGLTSPRSSSPSTWLGEYGPGGLNYGWYAGLLDEVSVYGRALGAEEILRIYQGGSAGKFLNCPPVIVVPPRHQTVLLGAGAAFSVTAEGSGPLSYQWYRNGVPVGGNAPVLTVSAVQWTDAGQYRVRVSSASGSTTSSVAVLRILWDGDGDGLDDGWETEQFGNLQATAGGDPDGDGLSNLEEYLIGSPATVRQPLGITIVRPRAGGGIP